MTTRIEHIVNALNDAGFSARAWNNRRVYINKLPGGNRVHRNVTAYLEVDDPSEPPFPGGFPLEGTALKVWVSGPQRPATRVKEAKQWKLFLMREFKREGLVDVEELPSDWTEVIL